MSDFDLDAYFLEKIDIDGRGIDPFLQTVSDLANKVGLEAGITLAVAGGVITGTLISRNTYFSLFADQFLDGLKTDEENAAAIRESFIARGVVEPDEGGNIPPTHFIHLKDAKYVYFHGSVPSNGSLWRGRLNSVTGFSLGRFN